MSDLPVIDLPTLHELTRYCDPGMLGVILDAFLSSAPQLLSQAERGQAAGELETVARAIHTLRSGVGSLGAKRMAPIAAELEAAARAGETARCAALLTQLLAEYQAVRDRLATILQDPARHIAAWQEP